MSINYKNWREFFEDQREELSEILETIKERCSKPGISLIPQPWRIFRSFDECSLQNVKVVMMGQEPYHTLDNMGRTFANGVAFSVDGDQETPTLRIMRQWLYSCYPEQEGKSMDMTLASWCRQGVLLINASLTVEYTEKHIAKISHRRIWEYFVRECIRQCSARGNVVFVFLGSVAGEYDDSVFGDNEIIKTEHPASIARKNQKIAKSTLFIDINKKLQTRGERPINWCSVFYG